MADKKSARQIKLLNMDYDDFIKDLQDFSKIYFPENYKNLTPASSGQMFLEETSFIGTVLSHYLEDRFKNANLLTAKDIDSIYNLSRFLGYKPEGPRAARGLTNFYLEVPSKTGSFGDYVPDMRYAINFKNVQLQNNNGIIFESLDDVDFTKTNTSSSLEARVSRRSTSGQPTHFVLKYKAEVMAGKTITQTTTVGDYKAWKKIEISEPNVLDIVSVTDSEGDRWYEVDFAAQEAIFEGIKNSTSDAEDVPYVLKIKTVPKRFVKVTNPKTGKTSLIFGPGKATEIGTPFVPDPADLAIDLKGKLNFTPTSIDPQNFLKTRNLGLAPYNTTLTIKARIGGGKITNTSEGSLREIIAKESDFNSSGLNAVDLNNTLTSFSTNNTDAIFGGDESETIEEIKQNASAHFAAQNRLNSREDYIARCLSLPSKFGKVFRVFATTNCTPNGGVQIFVVAKNHLEQLSTPSASLKKNLKNYLSQFTRLGQGLDILNGNIVNLGIDYTIVVTPGYNKTKVKVDTLNKVKDYFSIEKWQLNQPIIVDEIRCLLMETEGVLSISDLSFKNKNNTMEGSIYSSTVFNVVSSTRNGIIFCPENSIFEVKYPNIDIRVGAL